MESNLQSQRTKRTHADKHIKPVHTEYGLRSGCQHRTKAEVLVLILSYSRVRSMSGEAAGRTRNTSGTILAIPREFYNHFKMRSLICLKRILFILHDCRLLKENKLRRSTKPRWSPRSFVLRRRYNHIYLQTTNQNYGQEWGRPSS